MKLLMIQIIFSIKNQKIRKKNPQLIKKRKKLQAINEKANKLFNMTKNRIKNSFGNGKSIVVELIENEIKERERRLKESDNDIDSAEKKILKV